MTVGFRAIGKVYVIIIITKAIKNVLTTIHLQDCEIADNSTSAKFPAVPD